MTQESRAFIGVGVDPFWLLLPRQDSVGSPGPELLRIKNLAEFVAGMRSGRDGNGNGHGEKRNGYDRAPVISRPVEALPVRADQVGRRERGPQMVPARSGSGRRRR